MTGYDAIIVGGGPAGSTCASRLASAGMNVAVVEKVPFPRDKACAGWIPSTLPGVLGFDVEDYGDGRTLESITGFRTCLMYGDHITTHYDRSVSFAIRRSEFDHFLLNRCKAKKILNEPVTRIEKRGRAWVINGHMTSPLLIGAGGRHCPVGRLVRSNRGTGPLIVASVVEFKIGRDDTSAFIRSDTPALYFCRDFEGYGWAIRKGEYLNLGLGRLVAKHFRAHLDEFHKHLYKTGVAPFRIPAEFTGHTYLAAGKKPGWGNAAEGTILVGDAAGVADPRTGEGIYHAVLSSQMAADVILASGGEYGEGWQIPYIQRLDILGKDADPAWYLPSSLRHYAARIVLNSPFLTRHYLLDGCFLKSSHSPLLPSD